MALDVYRDWLNIQSPKRPLDHYTLLGLKRFEDDRNLIQKQYRQRTKITRQYSTGKFANESQDLLDELARAMLTLTDQGRKSEYDRKHGRKTKRPPIENRPFDRILLDEGKINQRQLEDATALSEQLGIDLRNALVQKGYLKWEPATEYLAQHYNMPYANLAEMNVSADAVKMVKARLAQRENIFPFLLDDDNLFVALSNALDVETLDKIRFEVGIPVRAVLCSPPAIRKMIEQHYGSAKNAKLDQAEEDAEDDDDGEAEQKQGVSLTGFLWTYAKWIAPLLAAICGAVGYSLFGATGAAVAALGVLVIFFVVLFVAS